MKGFLRNVALFVALQIVIGALVWSRYRPDPEAYVAAIGSKHERLQREQGPRLILLGGSNIALGLSAEQLTNELGISSVNMGIHANLGRDFMLAEVIAELRAGDVVVLSPEYQQFDRDPAPITLMQLLELNPDSRGYVPAHYLPSFFDEGLVLIGQRTRRALFSRPAAAPPYSRGSFNDRGDVIAHHGMAPRRPLAPFYFEQLNDANIARAAAAFEHFTVTARERGARAYYLFPPIPEAIMREYQPQIQRIDQAVIHHPAITRLNAPYSYPDDCFFDTAYHLTDTCTKRRSAELAASLKAKLQ